MAIYVITGKPRSGKTYFLTRNIVDWIKQGERIYSNVWIDLKSPFFSNYYKKYNLSAEKIEGDLEKPADLDNDVKQVFYWRHIRDWNKMKQGIIIADEGTRYFNPRKWSLLSEETEIKLQQHGKEDLDIWLTTQHYTRLDITLRILVERFLCVEKILGATGNQKFIWGVIKITEHYLEDMERLERASREDIEAMTIYSEYMLLRKKYCRLYNTRQMVGHSDPMELRHEERTCKTCGKVAITHA